MSDLQTRAAELIAAGYYVAPAHAYALLTPGIDPRKTPYTAAEAGRGPDLNIYLGVQPSGLLLYKYDLDTFVPAHDGCTARHTPGQNAAAARAGLRAARPELEAKIDWHPSKNGGLHGYYLSHKRLETGKLYDQAGNHIGELLGADTDRSLDPGDLNLTCLHVGELERLADVWHVKGSAPKGERWADRAKQGERWTRGAQHIPATKKQLRTFLQNDAGPVGKQLDTYFDKPPRNRSDAAGTLMQNLMFFARKLPGCANAPFPVICANVKAYWMAADSFGKAGEEGYSQDKDGDSLLAQIVNGDPYGPVDNPRYWKIPHWVPGNTATAAPAPTPAPEAPRPAHRPTGDRAKQIARLKRLLTHRWEDETTGRFYYFADDLDEWAARCGVSRRSVQSYLTDLETDGQIVRGQESGRAGGRPWMQIEPAFFGMQVTPEATPKAVPEPDKIAVLWDADPIADSGILTPQTAESTPVCIGDHQNTCVPTPEPGGASYVPGRDWTAGGRLDLSGWHDPSVIRVPLEPVDRTLPHRPRQQPRQKGQRTIEAEIREPMAERQAREQEARIERLAANVARAVSAGQQPAKRADRLAELRAQRDKVYPSDPVIPTPYRPRAALVMENLPEPPAAAAPAGAQCAGALLPGPQAGAPAGATPAQRMAERRRRLEAQQVPR